MASPANSKTTGRDGTRFYTWKGERYWSVTTLLSALDKPALVYWSAGEVAEFAVDNVDAWLALANTGQRDAAIDLLKRAPYRKKKDAADRGTIVHAAVEAFILGLPRSEDPLVAPYLDQFAQFVEEYKPEFLLSEARGFNSAQKYAGTLDIVAKIDGETWLLDVKTGNPGKDTGHGIWPETAMQQAAYSRFEFLGMPDDTEAEMPKIDRAAGLWLRSDTHAVVPVRIDEDVFSSFLYCREMYRWKSEIAGSAVGKPMIRTVAA